MSRGPERQYSNARPASPRRVRVRASRARVHGDACVVTITISSRKSSRPAESLSAASLGYVATPTRGRRVAENVESLIVSLRSDRTAARRPPSARVRISHGKIALRELDVVNHARENGRMEVHVLVPSHAAAVPSGKLIS